MKQVPVMFCIMIGTALSIPTYPQSQPFEENAVPIFFTAINEIIGIRFQRNTVRLINSICNLIWVVKSAENLILILKWCVIDVLRDIIVVYIMTSSNGNIFLLLAICAGNSPVPDEFPTQRPVTRSFDVFFDLRTNKRLSKQWWCWWFETQSCPLRRHCNVIHVSWTIAASWSQLSKSHQKFLIDFS